MMAEQQTLKPARGCAKWGTATVILCLLLCLGACTLAGVGMAINGRAGGGPLRAGSGMMDVCAGMVLQPRFQVGLGWQASILSRMPPDVIRSPYAVCVGFPAWPAPLPYRGEYMFPP
jgi:hypothetical protein